ncbi:hypothetical protein Pedsa_2013 [Pseudopedobacter saltans DSM 12145]|uniref:DUF748 domain-containing protein n=1 Tax=Pseudopedobacter saltans (strain ATCC 51119 / DSM 12145 / JCM 21818 / CCUG 39354 / LMG 10337 / NBRC 100064 / NCIMB 13643) TaxID=762903 RepID=F0SA07_PSESL|nr:hypothetical protein [Pseudopedobacter saltans]ADY52565.1 hypothetical protein Pedsa_2013 [Pseudopedobacter saltans DSM 12145]
MKKILLWTLGIVIIAVIGFFAVTRYLSNNWRPLLEEQLKKAVLSSTDSLYRIEYKMLDIHPINGNLKLTNFKLIPDTVVYKKLDAEKAAPDNLYELEVSALVIKNANAKEAVTTKELKVADIIINKPRLIIYNNRRDYNDTVTAKKEHRPLHQLIKDIFKDVNVGQIDLRDIDFTFVNRSNANEKRTSLKNLDITITDIKIDSLAALDKSRVYYTKDVTLNIKDYKIVTPDSLYVVKLENLNFSTSKNLLSLKKVKLEPRLGKNQFHKKLGHAQDRYDLIFNEINIQDFDFDLFLNRQKLYAKTFSINNAKIDVYNNNAYRKIIKNKTGKFPHQQLLKLALDMKIDELKLKDVDISYSEFDKKSKQVGKIDFLNTSGTIKNVVNDKKALDQNSKMVASLKSKIFGRAPLTLKMTFYMNSKIGEFDYHGYIGPFKGTIINQIVKPLGMAEIIDADIKKIEFNVKANQNIARGSMQFYYKDLRVNVLKRDEEGELRKQGLASTLANIFVLNTQNPSLKGEFTNGNIYYVRPAEASFFSFLWKSLFTGIKESVGVSNEREKSLKNTAEAIGNAVKGFKGDFHILKQTLSERKAQRKQKREERKLEKEAKKTQEELSDSIKRN